MLGEVRSRIRIPFFINNIKDILMLSAQHIMIPVDHNYWYGLVEIPSGTLLKGSATMNYLIKQYGGMPVLLRAVSEQSFYYGYSNGFASGHYQGFGYGYSNGVSIGHQQGVWEGYQMALNQLMMNPAYNLNMQANYSYF